MSMIKKRGFVVLASGIALISISFGIMFVAFPNSDPTLDSELFVDNLFDEMFDHISDQSVIFPGGSATFSYSSQNSGVPLMWAAQIVDFEDGDTIKVNISNIRGDDLDSVQTNESAVFDVFMTEDIESYNFEVQNTGERTVAVMMMFAEDPENSEMLNDPTSPLANIIALLAISGVVMLVGVIVMIVGIVLFVIDWKKEKNRPESY